MAVDVGAVDRTKGSAPVAMRPTLAGLNHMVSAGHYLAAHAGFGVLEAGGNAVDAGVAAGIALSVVQSDFVNFAGVAPILVYMADTGEVSSISGLGWWPKAASLGFFVKEFGGNIPVGILRTVVPAAPDAWITALERFGTMSFAEVAASAIGFAESGFVMYPLMAEMIATNLAGYNRWESSRQVYLPNGAAPRVGDVFRQRDLANTIRYMADEEKAHAHRGRSAGLCAARDAFYRGDIARRIVDYHQAHGGFLSMADFDSFSVEVEPAIRSSFHGTDLYACGFWCQGPSLLQILNMLEHRDLKALGHNTPDYIHLLVETTKLAFADREAYYGDPRHLDVPAAALLSKDYAKRRVALVDDRSAVTGLAPAGDVPDGPRPPQIPPEIKGTVLGTGTDPRIDTSFVCVVDRHGNAFAATPSDASNNTPVIPGTGLCPSSRGCQSWARPGHPAAVAPLRRPRLTPNPAIAIRPGRFVMPFGTPGGDVQSQAMLQVFLNIDLFGMDMQQAVEAPRFATYSFPSSFEPHTVEINRLVLEDLIPAQTGDVLAEKGHEVQWWRDRNWRAGGVCTVRLDVDSGIRRAAADPRRPSYALGY
ncbi:MAG TPA: gamma-glutamyltransferase [Hyphomicrobiaceae bacterium]